MCNDVGVMIDDGSQFQKKGIDFAKGLNYGTIVPWTIRCEPSVYAFDDEDGCEYLRVVLKPCGDDADSDQPDVVVYVDLDDWDLLKYAVKCEIRRYRRDSAIVAAERERREEGGDGSSFE